MKPESVDPRPSLPDLEEARVQAVVATRLFGETPDVPKIGRFAVLERVGHGGMGDVYSAYDPQLDRRVAIKLLHRETSDNRLLREARTLASINHPNVVQVYEVGLAGERVFIAMEFVQGQTLRAWRDRGSRSWREVLTFYIQAACGLAAAHAAGVIHRDFKPDNALVGEDGRVRVVDFGLARVDVDGRVTLDPDGSAPASGVDGGTTLTATGSIAGTPAYMAPEQFRKQTVDERSDQFAFCVALHEALHGSRPYMGTSPAEIADKIQAHEIDRAGLDASVPDWVVRPILRGLSPDPQARHPSMQSLIDALRRDPSRRRRAWIALGAVTIAGAAALGWQVVTRSRTAAECEAEGEVVGEVWHPARAAELEQALLGTGFPYAADTWNRLQPRMEGWAEAWAAASTRTCARERLEGSITPPAARAARECLGEQLAGVSALLERLEEPNAEVLRRALASVTSLPSSDACLDEADLARRRRSPPADAKDAAHEVRRELARAEALLSTASYEDALTIAEGALGRAEGLGWPPLEAEARRLIGLVQRDMGQFEAARASLEKAFYLAGSSGHDHVALSAASGLVQTVGFRMASYEEGLHWYSLGRMHADRLALADDAPDRATLLVSVSTVYIQHGKYERAQTVLEQALSIQERSLGIDHPDVANTLVNLATLHHTRGAYDEALALFQRALEQKERIVGSDHPDVAMLFNNIGVVHRSLTDYDNALEAHERALRLRRSALGPDHPDVAASLINIGNVQFEMGAYSEALAAYENAHGVQREALGPGHPDVAKSLGGLAKVHYARGEHDEALAAAKEAFSVAEAALGSDHMEVGEALNVVAVMHQARGDVGAAMEAQQRALAIWEKSLGADHPMVAMALSNIGVFHRIQGDSALALEAHQRASQIRERKLGSDHTDLAASLTNIGNVHADLGHDEKALAAYGRALGIYEQALGPDHPLVATVLEATASIQLRGHATAKAIAGYERALAIRERSEAAPAELATARFGLAQALWEGRVDRQRARKLAEQAHRTFTELGPRGKESAKESAAWLSKR